MMLIPLVHVPEKAPANLGEALLRLTAGARSVSSDTIRQAHT